MDKSAASRVALLLVASLCALQSVSCQTTIPVPADHSVIEGDAVTFSCTAYKNGTVPTLVIAKELSLGEAPLTNTTDPGRITIHSSFPQHINEYAIQVDAVIARAEVSDAGRYSCMVSSEGIKVYFDVSVLPRASIPSLSMAVINSTDGILMLCEGSSTFDPATLGGSTPRLSARWRHNSNAMTTVAGENMAILTNQTDKDHLSFAYSTVRTPSSGGNFMLSTMLNLTIDKTSSESSESWYGKFYCEVTIDFAHDGTFHFGNTTYLSKWTPKPTSTDLASSLVSSGLAVVFVSLLALGVSLG